MRGQLNGAAIQRQRAVARHRLSDEEEAWIARQLDAAPPLTGAARRRIERLLSLPPDQRNLSHDARAS
jgi:hypothetical protein